MMNNKHGKLLSLLGFGEENAISMKELATLLDASCRDVRRMIESARTDGIIIASSDKGYFYPTRDRELSDYCSRTALRIQSAVLAFAPAYRERGYIIRIVIEEVEDNDE